ncbi:MAG: hypothetical protein JW934_06295 [Anaerolineae bacterium]|nr:hypothetical protein [Anaerolineae bacterium]
MNLDDIFAGADELLSQFGPAPERLKALIHSALVAIKEKQFGEALNKLCKADELLEREKQALAGWQAEVAVTWALYYASDGPELEPKAMWDKIIEAQRLEPENERLDQVIALIKAKQPKPPDDK